MLRFGAGDVERCFFFLMTDESEDEEPGLGGKRALASRFMYAFGEAGLTGLSPMCEEVAASLGLGAVEGRSCHLERLVMGVLSRYDDGELPLSWLGDSAVFTAARSVAGLLALTSSLLGRLEAILTCAKKQTCCG